MVIRIRSSFLVSGLTEIRRRVNEEDQNYYIDLIIFLWEVPVLSTCAGRANLFDMLLSWN
jgi:hypothetical protein